MSSRRTISPSALRGTAALLVSALLFVAGCVEAQQIDIAGPSNSVAFGTGVAVLQNGNIVVTDPGYETTLMGQIGAVYLYRPTGVLISTLTGSGSSDQIGSGGVVVLANGNYLINSPQWNGGAGAITWAGGENGVSGVVSSSNSLTVDAGSSGLASGGITTLANGNYVVNSPDWPHTRGNPFEPYVHKGAVTWGDGTTGVTGVLAAQNSLVGTGDQDKVGNGGVTALSHGNYVVGSPAWTNTALGFAGAVTWGNGVTGTVGPVSANNSLTGSGVGSLIAALSNGNYVVGSPLWNGGVGAATWVNGSVATSSVVTAANSLTGSLSTDNVGSNVFALANGNYVVRTSAWSNGGISGVGAVTWGNGSGGSLGTVSAANSLIGTTADDQVGSFGITTLNNGNYVVLSGAWHNGGSAFAGAATWAPGDAITSAAVSIANSLVGTTAGDQVGIYGVALSNGNYVIPSAGWDNNGTADVGAVTWGNGSTGTSGAVQASNSLIGTSSSDRIGISGVTALSNGNYVVCSTQWDNSANGGTVDVGAVTWANGSTGLVGVVSAANSLIGTTAGDGVGSLSPVTALGNGNYVVSSPGWHNNTVPNIGAVTWGNGSAGISGPVSIANSLIGSTNGDLVGTDVFALGNNNFAVRSPSWSTSPGGHVGAITLGRGRGGTRGVILPTNSVLGTVAGAGSSMVFVYDAARDTLIVGRPASNIVSLFKADQLFTNGYE